MKFKVLVKCFCPFSCTCIRCYYAYLRFIFYFIFKKINAYKARFIIFKLCLWWHWSLNSRCMNVDCNNFIDSKKLQNLCNICSWNRDSLIMRFSLLSRIAIIGNSAGNTLSPRSFTCWNHKEQFNKIFINGVARWLNYVYLLTFDILNLLNLNRSFPISKYF